MNDVFNTEISNETGTDNTVSVSGNDVEPTTETVPQDNTETKEETETDNETVSGNDVSAPADSSDSGTSESVSGNGSTTISYVPYDDSALTAQIGNLTTEVSALNQNVSELHGTVIGISGLLLMLLGFTVFKWCEQKIKRFTKGVFNKYE